MPIRTCTVRVPVWAHTPRRPQATDPTVAMEVEGEVQMLPEGTRTDEVALQSTTPTGGIKYEIEVSIMTAREGKRE